MLCRTIVGCFAVLRFIFQRLMSSAKIIISNVEVNFYLREVFNHILREKTAIENQKHSFDVHLFNGVGECLDVLYTAWPRPYHCRKAGVCAAKKCQIYLRNMYLVFIISFSSLLDAHGARECGAHVKNELLDVIENALEYDILPIAIDTNYNYSVFSTLWELRLLNRFQIVDNLMGD